MKTKNYLLLCLLLFSTVLLMNSCSKNDNDKDKLKEQNVPQNRTEAEQKISGKWSLPSSGDVKSIEFTSNNTYILEVSSESILARFSSTAPQVSNLSYLKQSKLASIGPLTSVAPSWTQFVTGTYTISADGKTVSLDQIATITIKDLTEKNFSFSITFKEGNKTIDVTLASTPPLDTTSKTTLLARTWVLTVWPSYYSDGELAEVKKKGFKPQDTGFTFTASGTCIVTYISMEALISPPVPEGEAPSPTIYKASLESAVGTWRWKDNAQNKVIVTLEGEEPEEISISNNTSSSITIDGDTYTAK